MSGNNVQNAIQNNLLLRQALMASSPIQRKNLGAFSGGTLGGTTRIKVFNTGIITRLVLRVDTQLDIGTAQATLSPKAPYNLINRIRLTDYDGTDRVNCSGSQLFMLNCARRGTYYGYNNESNAISLLSPAAPITVGTAQALSFFIEVPLAFDPSNDLRGSLLGQTAVGDCYLNIDWNPTLYANGNADAVYNGAATTTVSLTAGYAPQINVQCWQEYYLPQLVQGQLPLPPLDLMTVYEIAGNIKSSDNLAANTEKLINYPNVRSVIGSYFEFVNGGVMAQGSTDIAQLRLIANGNNILVDNTAASHLFEMRLILNSDLRSGMFFNLHRKKAIETAQYGNVQFGVTPNVVNSGNTHIDYMFESFYTKGISLPGLSQASG